MDKAVELGQNAVAICDDKLYGVYEFYYYAKKRGIKPIIGLSLEDRILIAKDYNGYENLIKVASNVDSDNKNLFCIATDTSKLEELKETYGKNLYLGICEEDEKIFELSKKYGVPLCAIPPVRYINKEDEAVYNAIHSIKTTEEDSSTYLKNEYEMGLSGKYKIAILNTDIIAAGCDVVLPENELHLPKIADNEDELLRELAYKSDRTKDKERLEFELEVVSQMGFSGYFLIVSDICRAARELGVGKGAGRGSSAGSYLAYVLGITDIDPIEHGLYFERFLNPDRATMPDIDLDFEDLGRDKIIEYVKQKYGEENVCQIITFGRLGARGAIRDVARTMGISLAEVDDLIKLIPQNTSLKDNEELKNIDDENIQKLIATAEKLEGIIRNKSTHAAGIIISSEPLYTHIPVEDIDGRLVSQYDMNAVEKAGMLKMDLLGLKNLRILDNIEKQIAETPKYNLDDKATYELLSNADTDGIFQLESPGMKRFLKELKPKEFNDIALAISVYRPGPMDNIPELVARRNGKEYTSISPILDETYGIMVYQEQVMKLVQELAGYTMAEADNFRRAMSKKKPEIMQKEREKFLASCKRKDAEQIFNDIEKFAGFAFNKAHAIAYSDLSFKLAYLKANNFLEFVAGTLATEDSDSKKLKFLSELQKKNIEILRPNINKSNMSYSVSNGGLFYGLSSITGVNSMFADLIIKERDKGEYKDFTDFAIRISHQTRLTKPIESLIKAGCFDDFDTRRTLLANLDNIIKQAKTFNVDSFVKQEIEYTKYPEYNEIELAKLEQEVLSSSFGKIYIKIKTARDKAKLQKELSKNIGLTPVYIYIEDEKKYMLASEKYWQDIQELSQVSAKYEVKYVRSKNV